jgi:DNA-binding NtrC family response regulator
MVPLLCHFVEKKNRKFNMTKKIAPLAVGILSRYSWPGNVRELRNVVEHMMIMCEKDILDEKCIPAHISNAATGLLGSNVPARIGSYNLKEIVAEVEKEVIKKAIAEFGSMRSAARHLGMDLSTLVRKKRRHKV